MKEADFKPVIEFIAHRAGASTDLELLTLAELDGGDSKENWFLDVNLNGGPHAGRQRLIVRVDEQELMPNSHNCVQEFHLLEYLSAQEIPVPRPLFLCEDKDIYPRPFFVMERLPGKSTPEKLVADLSQSEAGEKLILAIADVLVRLHKIRPPQQDLIFLESPPENPAERRLKSCYAQLDRFLADTQSAAYPVVEWGLRWCATHIPEKQEVTLVHGDMRLDNILVSEGHLQGIVDWEYATWCDPYRDLASFCAKFARYGAYDRAAGGLADKDVFLNAYHKQVKREFDANRFAWWEILVNIERILACIEYGRRHQSGLQISLGLALQTHNIGALELEVLSLADRLDRRMPVKRKKKHAK